MATLTAKRYECPDDGYLLLKSKATGDEGFCPLVHEVPVRLEYKGEVVLTTV